ncbi:hypothetical protein [Georgenia faecalis]|uniref:Uncharacterized protein n=1 Tax=Georgenia faecalis TaxID=2483799 RepID=A0ABV9D5G4_9MICO|nr:hypothetical protein [Georgenia faecalis]
MSGTVPMPLSALLALLLVPPLSGFLAGLLAPLVRAVRMRGRGPAGSARSAGVPAAPRDAAARDPPRRRRRLRLGTVRLGTAPGPDLGTGAVVVLGGGGGVIC